MGFWSWFRGDGDLVIEHWTQERAEKHERDTLTRMGRVAEPTYDWHAKWLKAQKKARKRKVEVENVRQFRKRA